MLDFDFMCGRKKPSVAAMVFPFNGNHYTKLYWGTEEALIPVYTTTAEAVAKHADATIMINFASFRSVYETVEETLKYSHQIKVRAVGGGWWAVGGGRWVGRTPRAARGGDGL